MKIRINPKSGQRGIAPFVLCVLVVITAIVAGIIIHTLLKICKLLNKPQNDTNTTEQIESRLNIDHQAIWTPSLQEFYRTKCAVLADGTNNTSQDVSAFDGMVFTEALQASLKPAGHPWETVYWVTGYIHGGWSSTTTWDTNHNMVGSNYAPVILTPP